MRKFLIALVATSLLMASGCTMQTEYGDCKGIATENEKNPKLVYETSAWNVAMDVIFSETLVAPVVGLGFALWCPVGEKK